MLYPNLSVLLSHGNIFMNYCHRCFTMLFDVRTVGVYLEVNLGQRGFKYNIALNYMKYRFYLGELLILVAAKRKQADYAYLL